jgi:hypothetical protein
MMCQQIVRQLCDREDEHQVEEQLDEVDPVVGQLSVVAKMGTLRHRHMRPIPRPKRKPCG